jgi:hypothetical protein
MHESVGKTTEDIMNTIDIKKSKYDANINTDHQYVNTIERKLESIIFNDGQHDDSNVIFDELMEDTNMHYYLATAIKKLIDTKDLPVFYTSKAASEAIDLIIKWRNLSNRLDFGIGYINCQYHRNPKEFSTAIFGSLEDSRALAVTLIIMGATTADTNLSGIYMDAAIGILDNECIIKEDVI